MCVSRCIFHMHDKANLTMDPEQLSLLSSCNRYGCGANEELLGSVLNEPGNREKVFLATKFGSDFDRKTRQLKMQINGKPDYARSSLDESLKRLNLPYVDLYYLHRVDSTV